MDRYAHHGFGIPADDPCVVAEDESHSISANCRWGLQKRFENGTYRAASAPYGYDLVNGNYAVNELEAEIEKEIFSRALAGEVLRQIAADLNARRIRTKRDGQTWKDHFASCPQMGGPHEGSPGEGRERRSAV